MWLRGRHREAKPEQAGVGSLKALLWEKSWGFIVRNVPGNDSFFWRGGKKISEKSN